MKKYKPKKIYLESIRLAENTIFSVDESKEQKMYFNPIFNRFNPYASGQQIKRNILAKFVDALEMEMAPVTFVYEFDDKKIKNKQPLSSCDPSFPDQLIGGYMMFESIKKAVTDEGDKSAAAKLKRESPLSISCFVPMHPLLAQVFDTHLTFDRPGKGVKHPVIMKDKKGNIIEVDDMLRILRENNRTDFASQIHSYKLVNGMFKETICIDLETLFSVNIGNLESSVTDEIKEKLIQAGYVESQNKYGKCLVAPRNVIEEYAPALAHSLIHWEINSNQSRSHSPLPILAVAISNISYETSGSFYCKMSERDENKMEATPFIDFSSGANIFVSRLAQSYFRNDDDHMKFAGLNNAEQKLTQMIVDFDYVNQKFTI